MGEAAIYTFSYKELAEILVRKQGLHEGLWGIAIKFGMHGTSIETAGQDYVPAAVVSIMEIGIQKHDQPNPFTVDAALVNPRTTPARKPRKKSAQIQ